MPDAALAVLGGEALTERQKELARQQGVLAYLGHWPPLPRTPKVIIP
ncbi:hypothetical protein AB0P36_34740 [Streptomyces flavidovirens]